MLLYAVGVVPARRKPQSGRISALAPLRRLRACTPKRTAALSAATTIYSYNIQFKSDAVPRPSAGGGGGFVVGGSGMILSNL
ncbi:hypothetical protein BSB13_23185 [Salmonella enterica]|uniref:Uncharacterized protein n=1 Tax=Salmonella enterica subsp. enterica serovar Saintpaul TaxID=90105 RepID=A0A5W5JMD5_SALET|nr:hypothetical protein [Salmonella enterica]EBX1946847.1 hypothetical protein [Salmonella enterica subsp. enterica serovar Saintpaul]EBK2803093.1 hypothetical protein [Salmonella enterica]EBK6649392.1 hypothetical protein [Salmonella enterica]EBY0515157.1 hypothetical protein [Salmonella enterica subsp. enterica serovar Saintpaul]